jgi:hypothetical protein
MTAAGSAITANPGKPGDAKPRVYLSASVETRQPGCRTEGVAFPSVRSGGIMQSASLAYPGQRTDPPGKALAPAWERTGSRHEQDLTLPIWKQASLERAR